MPRFRLAALGLLVSFSLLAVGCADRSVRKPLPHPARPMHTMGQTTDAAARHRAGEPASDTGTTGIVACDDYLASYRACHRAAGIFEPDQVEPRYREMRQSLLRDAQDPDTRPQLAARCTSLAQGLRDALHGKPCASSPTTNGPDVGP